MLIRKNFYLLAKNWLFLSFFSWSLITLGHLPDALTAPPPDPIKITPSELIAAMPDALNRVDEFLYIKQEAQKLNVRVYLFGGTAAAFAHYLKWDLSRQKGDLRFNPERFDYRYINIYRSTQDLDIVVDGSSSAIKELETAILHIYPYLQGSKKQKQAWEIRSLRENIGDKLALLNNPEFLNQNTDSNSVGLIEITDPQAPQERIRDLRDWNNTTNSGFLTDVTEGKIHFYFSLNHERTQFFKEGRNPAIISVIRYLIKAFQFDLAIAKEDLPIISKIISEFDPLSLNKNSYLPKWFADNAPKLLQNSIDVELAMKVLESLHLKEKLIQIGNKDTLNSVAWWMNKKPLFSRPLGTVGQTAAGLGLDIVAHETTSFSTYEAISRSHKSTPNVFISRNEHKGESALFGDGFYVMKGENSGYRSTGFTIRFKLKPNARLNYDFLFDGDKKIAILNKSAIKMIPENLTMDLIQYYNWMLSEVTLIVDNLGIYHRLRLALRARFANPNVEEKTFLKTLNFDELLILFEKDPALDSKILLLKLLQEKITDPSDSLRLFEYLKNWRKKNSSSDTEVIFNKLETGENNQTDFVIQFLNLKPNQTQLEKAFELTFFKDTEDLFIENMLPYLNSKIKILDFLKNSKWHSKTILNSKKTMVLIEKLIKQFMNFKPDLNERTIFLKFIPNANLDLSAHFQNQNSLFNTTNDFKNTVNDTLKTSTKEINPVFETQNTTQTPSTNQEPENPTLSKGLQQLRTAPLDSNLYFDTLKKFLTTDQFHKLNLLNRMDLVLDIYKFLVLKGIKNEIETHPNSVQKQKEIISNLLLLPDTLPNNLLRKQLKRISLQIETEFQDLFPSASDVWGQSENLYNQISHRLKSIIIDKKKLTEKLKNEIIQTQNRLSRAENINDDLKNLLQFDYLNPIDITCQNVFILF